jgi:hypothetical protein
MNTNQNEYEKFYQKNAHRSREEHSIELGEINVLIGENARENTLAAYQKAMALMDAGLARRAIVANCVGNQRWALKLARSAAPGGRIGDSAHHHIQVVGSSAGRLCKEYYSIRLAVEERGIDLVLINSWELTSCNSRYREELLFQLRELCEMNVTVIVYSQANIREYKPGLLMRGTLGRLSVVAAAIEPALPFLPDEGGEEEAIERSEHFISSDGFLNGAEFETEEEDRKEQAVEGLVLQEA